MAKMTVKKKTGNFTILDNTSLKDENLSWKAKGLLAYLLHLPDDWCVYLEDLKNRSKDGKDGTRGAVNELIDNGYILREKKKNGTKFDGYNYTVLEKPYTVKPTTEIPTTENPTVVSTKKTKLLKTVNTIKTLGEQLEELQISKNLKDKFIEYIDYRKEIKKPLKTMRPINSAIKNIGKEFTNEQHLIESMEFSMGKEYQGIIPKKSFKKKEFEPTSWLDIMEKEKETLEVEYIDNE